MQTTETEKLRAALQAALDALPPAPAPEPKKAPAWLGSLSREDHGEMCKKLSGRVHHANFAAHHCLHALLASGPNVARAHLNVAADHIRAALAELEGC